MAPLRPALRSLLRCVPAAAAALALALAGPAVTVARPASHGHAASKACRKRAAKRRRASGCAKQRRRASTHRRAAATTKKPAAPAQAGSPKLVLVPATCEDGAAPARAKGGAFTCEDGSAPSCEGAAPSRHAAGGEPLCAVPAEVREGECASEPGGECAAIEFTCGSEVEATEPESGCERTSGESETPEAEEEE